MFLASDICLLSILFSSQYSSHSHNKNLIQSARRTLQFKFSKKETLFPPKTFFRSIVNIAKKIRFVIQVSLEFFLKNSHLKAVVKKTPPEIL